MPDDNKPAARSVQRRSANQRLTERLGSADMLQGLEGFYREVEAVFHSAEMKRDYLRFYDKLQQDLHRISTLGRVLHVPEQKVIEVEDLLKSRVSGALEHMKNQIKRAEKLLNNEGLVDAFKAMRSLEPLTVVARVRSPLARRYLEAQLQADTVIRYLELLIIEEGIDERDGRREIAAARKVLQRIASLVRLSAFNIRRLAPPDNRGGASAGESERSSSAIVEKERGDSMPDLIEGDTSTVETEATARA